ncbi:HXXEE domain-containing protein [Kineosporia sp. J2-2]|uniref:HXXEE domain-containing protein n=1 Tax=Kineosporia corallincola TaxID=2835133 RepID=A0ABS5TDF2_9ACTN|nr:HXXEE domain-containing protein [Kineosporia corallincola]MBT0769112.1 HXXEE domain-containing protein [Kineosporia corallincola]
MRPGRRLTVATAGLFVSWLLHDLEEVATMRAGSAELLARVPERVPLPEGWREHGMPQEQVVTAVGLVGAVMAAASADGYRTAVRSGFYRAALVGYGLHGFGHLAGSAARRGYTSGAATSPVLVIPFWLWAERALRAGQPPGTRHVAEAGQVPETERLPGRVPLPAALLMLSLVPAAHLVAHQLLRRVHQAGVVPSGWRNSRRLPNGSAE